MESTENVALAQLTQRRFRSFSEAVDSVLGALEAAVPGAVLLGQLEAAEELCRVIEVRGTNSRLHRGMTLPLAADDAELEPEFLRSLSVEAWLGRPLEFSDGSIVGTLCALDTDVDHYRPDHMVLLGVAARLLSYEWENVTRGAELRRLREQVRDAESSDADTGLPNRESFIGLLEREWRLTSRGSVQSVLVACHITLNGAQNGHGETMANLALRDAAEVLNGTIRSTDHVGRTGAMDLAAILVGCHGQEGAQAFLRRFRSGVKRVTDGRAVPISASCSILALDESDSAGDALERAERAARDTSTADEGQLGAQQRTGP